MYIFCLILFLLYLTAFTNTHSHPPPTHTWIFWKVFWGASLFLYFFLFDLWTWCWDWITTWNSWLWKQKQNKGQKAKQKTQRAVFFPQLQESYTVEVRNRFKGLDLIDRIPDELWTEVRDIVQETGIKTIPMEKKCKKVVWGGLTNSCKRREAKSKGEKERYSPLNAEFQRIARRDKKAFLSNHCKEIEENNRMGKTRDLFKKIIDNKGTFHAKVCSITDRNSFNGIRKQKKYSWLRLWQI